MKKTDSKVLIELEDCLLRGMSYKSISRKLGKSEQSLKTLKCRWLKNLGSFDFGLNNFKHGDAAKKEGRQTRLYMIWSNMKRRCQNLNDVSYRRYGARGIKVCSEWQDYVPFKAWSIRNGYKDGLQIDRINNNGDYCPENCQWITRLENVRKGNKLKRKLSDQQVREIKRLYQCRISSQSELAEDYEICQAQISRIVRGVIYK